jgi:hypothetical protein
VVATSRQEAYLNLKKSNRFLALGKEVTMLSRMRSWYLGLVLIGLFLVAAYAFGQCCSSPGCWSGQVFLCQDQTCRYYSDITCAFDDNSGNSYTIVYTPNPCGGRCRITDPVRPIAKYDCPGQCVPQCPAPVPYPVEAALLDLSKCFFVRTVNQCFCAK